MINSVATSKAEATSSAPIEGTVAVTGATGFIGRSLCSVLTDHDCDVIGTTRSASPPEQGIKWRQANVTDADDVAEALEDADYVFHLAGIGLLDGDPETVRAVNVEGTGNVLAAARDHDIERVVFSSTAGTRHRPGKEAATEEDVADTIGAYQKSKLEAEGLVGEFVEEGGDAVVVHPTSVFGPGDPRLTPKLIGLVTSMLPIYLPGGGSVVSVDDVAKGLVLAAGYGRAGQHYVLGGENMTFGEMLDVIAEYAGEWKPPIRIPAFLMHLSGYPIGVVNQLLGTNFFPVNASMARLSTRHRYYDSSKAMDELGYSITPFEEHVDEAIEWYRETQS